MKDERSEGIRVSKKGTGTLEDNVLLTKVLSIENKRFYFDLKKNQKGKYLKVSEIVGDNKDTIIIPYSGLLGFREIFSEMINTID
ncbi:MAG: PUR family DNA/RNA-binding protein [Chlamydiota bacterium]|nr:PUR family DNA/RNA-binding protein [Chlamydiota bacterium]